MPPVSIQLLVTNLEQLLHGCRPKHVFDAHGGSVGSENGTWILRDSGGLIAPRHFEITLRDGHFCIIDTCGHTHLNGDPRPMGVGRIARLGDGDRIDVGSYRLAASMNATPITEPVSDVLQGGIPDFVSADAAEMGSHLDYVRGDHALLDPANFGQAARQDTHGDGSGTIDVAVNFGGIVGDVKDDAGALAAFEEGLGVTLGSLDPGATRALLRQLGETVRSEIEGVAALQSSAQHSGSQAEDSPSRLGPDTATTVWARFGAQLGPPQSSPAEVMRNAFVQLARQKQATQCAIDADLAALLDAFAPQKLAQRFERYAEGDTSRNSQWFWSFYGAYYQDVMTSHAQGTQRSLRGASHGALNRAVRAALERTA